MGGAVLDADGPRTCGLCARVTDLCEGAKIQAGKSLFGKSSWKEIPQWHEQLQRPMNIFAIDEIRQTDKRGHFRYGRCNDQASKFKRKSKCI